MKKHLSTFLILLFWIGLFLVPKTAFSQKDKPEYYFHPKGYRYNNYFELSGILGSNQFGGFASWSHFHGIGKKKQRFKIGYGARFTSYFGSDKDFVTAPSKLTRGMNGIASVFSDKIIENFDTIRIRNSQTNSLNIFFTLQYTFFDRLDVGGTLELVGFSFGGKVTSMYSSAQNAPGTYSLAQSAAPTGYNVLLTGDNNIGNLNYDVYLRFWISNQWAVRASVYFTHSEYTTQNDLRLDNDRFRNRFIGASLGVTFCPWRTNIFKQNNE